MTWLAPQVTQKNRLWTMQPVTSWGMGQEERIQLKPMYIISGNEIVSKPDTKAVLQS